MRRGNIISSKNALKMARQTPQTVGGYSLFYLLVPGTTLGTHLAATRIVHQPSTPKEPSWKSDVYVTQGEQTCLFQL